MTPIELRYKKFMELMVSDIRLLEFLNSCNSGLEIDILELKRLTKEFNKSLVDFVPEVKFSSLNENTIREICVTVTGMSESLDLRRKEYSNKELEGKQEIINGVPCMVYQSRMNYE